MLGCALGSDAIGSTLPLITEAEGSQPRICQSSTSLTNSCRQEEDAPAQSFEVWNCGQGTLFYSITTDECSGWQPYRQRKGIIVMGGNAPPGSGHYGWYWGDTFGMYTKLTSYGFTDENVYFLSYGPNAEEHAKIVDAISTTAYIRSAYQWAQRVCTAEDLLYIYWVDHGSPSGFQTKDGTITHAELGTLMKPIISRQTIGAYNPCFSGAVIDDISGKGVITITSQDAHHGNSWGWAGQWRKALGGGAEGDKTDENGDGHISITEAYQWIAPKSRNAGEHSMMDDNGDRVGSESDHPGFDPQHAHRDGYNGKFYSLHGWLTPTGKGTSRASWLWCDPNHATSMGEHDTIHVRYKSAGLPCGSYSATITISASEAESKPQTIPVRLTVESSFPPGRARRP